jgi:hypothetical protein
LSAQHGAVDFSTLAFSDHLYSHGDKRQPTGKNAMQLLETMVVCHQDQLQQRLGKETAVITGASRGGTSMVAYGLLKLGYPLLSSGQRTHEDDEILAAWDSEPERSRVIAENNRRHERWGFKLPEAALHPNWCANNLRDPIFIMVYRNPLAVGRSKLSRNPERWGESADALAGALEQGLKMMASGTTYLGQNVPVVLVDFDAAKIHPNVFLKEIAQVFGLTIPAKEKLDEIGLAIALPGYNVV